MQQQPGSSASLKFTCIHSGMMPYNKLCGWQGNIGPSETKTGIMIQGESHEQQSEIK